MYWNHKPFIPFYLIDEINDGWMRRDKLIFFFLISFFLQYGISLGNPCLY